MAVIPLTLTISLCLVFTFVLFFLREYTRNRFSSEESDALLPLAEEGRQPAFVLDLQGREPRRRHGRCQGHEGKGHAGHRCGDCTRHD